MFGIHVLGYSSKYRSCALIPSSAAIDLNYRTPGCKMRQLAEDDCDDTYEHLSLRNYSILFPFWIETDYTAKSRIPLADINFAKSNYSTCADSMKAFLTEEPVRPTKTVFLPKSCV